MYNICVYIYTCVEGGVANLEYAKQYLMAQIRKRGSENVLMAASNAGEISIPHVMKLKEDPSFINELPSAVIVKLYQRFTDGRDTRPISSVFTKKELLDAALYTPDRKSFYPFKVNAMKLADTEEYITTLSMRDIYNASQSGVLQVRSDAQRESVFSYYGGQIVTHIKFNDSVARDISKEILAGTYHPDTLRWHLLIDDDIEWDYNYDENTHELCIQFGTILNIDGQHRTVGIEYALESNPSINLLFPVIISVGDVRTAQKIIAQDEKRQPISAIHVKSFAANIGGNIVQRLCADSELNEMYKFIDNPKQYRDGFIVKGYLADAIDREYKSASVKDQRKISKQIKELLVELYDTDDSHQISKNLLYAYIHIAARIGDNLDEILPKIVSEFQNNISASMTYKAVVEKADKIMNDIAKEV